MYIKVYWDSQRLILNLFISSSYLSLPMFLLLWRGHLPSLASRFLMWTIRLSRRMKRAQQKIHLYFLIPMWILSWLVRWPLPRNLRPQCLHGKFFSPVWSVLCFFNLLCQWNPFPQTLHINLISLYLQAVLDFSPWFSFIGSFCSVTSTVDSFMPCTVRISLKSLPAILAMKFLFSIVKCFVFDQEALFLEPFSTHQVQTVKSILLRFAGSNHVFPLTPLDWYFLFSNDSRTFLTLETLTHLLYKLFTRWCSRLRFLIYIYTIGCFDSDTLKKNQQVE